MTILITDIVAFLSLLIIIGFFCDWLTNKGKRSLRVDYHETRPKLLTPEERELKRILAMKGFPECPPAPPLPPSPADLNATIKIRE